MVNAYILFPDIFLDALEKESNNDNITYSKFFLSKLLEEKFKVSTTESKKYRGFIADYHWNCLIDTILPFLNSEKITEDEINIIQIILASVDRDGIEEYPYKDNYTPILDLAKDKSDSFDVFIVCNNQMIRQKIKEFMKKYSHFGSYPILSSKEAYLNL